MTRNSAMSRRGFLQSALGSLALVKFGACALDDRTASVVRAATAAPRTGTKDVKPKHSGIGHIVVVTMENRSFDHFLGWLPGANGKQDLQFPDANGVLHGTYALAPDFQGCGHVTPDNSWSGGRIEYDDGKCDGWLLGANDDFVLGYYRQEDLPFLGQAAGDWTVCDNYFAPIMAPTWPNRMYLHCGVTDRLDNSIAPSTLPTIWDRLAAAGVSAGYYASDAPFLGFWGPKYLSITHTVDAFYDACRTGTLPAVSYVDPPELGEELGASTDDHPFADIRAGESFLAKIYAAVTASPNWQDTVLVITFDEWGGFFDHVPPTTAPDVDPRFALRGFRVPTLLVSPLAQRGAIASTLFDHTSILKMIEWRHGLAPLSARDAAANNLADALVLGKHPDDLSAPAYSVPDAISVPCAL